MRDILSRKIRQNPEIPSFSRCDASDGNRIAPCEACALEHCHGEILHNMHTLRALCGLQRFDGVAAMTWTRRGWLAKAANKTGKYLRAVDASARSFDDRDLGVWDDPAQRDGIGYRINKDGRGRENDDASWRMLR
jgi:hypothetical protein